MAGKKDEFDSDFDMWGATPTQSVSRPSPPKRDPLDAEFDQFGYIAPEPPKAPGRGGVLDNAPDEPWYQAAPKFVGTAVAKGLSHIPGFVGDQAGFADYLLARGQSAITGKPVDQILGDFQQRRADMAQGATPVGKLAAAISPSQLPSGGDIQNRLFSVTGEYKPETAAGRAGMAGIETVVGSVAPGMAGRNPAMTPFQTAVRSAPVTGTMGIVGQSVAEATGDPLLGVAAGMAVPAALATGRAAGRGMMGGMSPERAALADAAVNKYGIPLGVGDLTNRLPIRFLSSVAERMPFSGSQGRIEAKQGAFNNAVASTFGENAQTVTRDVMARARDRIGSDFDLVARNTQIPPDATLTRDFANVVRNTQLGPAGVEQRVVANIQEIGNQIQRNGGVISGKLYQDLTRVGNPGNGRGAGLIQRLINDPDPNVREAGIGLRNALDDGLQRYAPPDMQQTLQTARAQWRNLRTVEDLVAKSPDGNISPALLQGRVNAKNKGTQGRAYNQGGDLGELADIGQAFLKQPPSSGTAERAFWLNMLPAVGGNMLALGSGNPWHGVAGVSVPLAGMAGGRVANSILSNPAVGNALIQRSLGVAMPNNGVAGYNLPLPYVPQAQLPQAQLPQTP